MSEGDAVAAIKEPVTPARLASDLHDLGVRGETILVHSSLRSLGWVPGGAQGVVDALREAVTETGTIVMPTHTRHSARPLSGRTSRFRTTGFPRCERRCQRSGRR